MVHAYVMVKSVAGASARVLDAIRGIDPVTEAHVVAGEFDLIVEVDDDEVYDLLGTVSNRIRGMEDVSDTRTYVALN